MEVRVLKGPLVGGVHRVTVRAEGVVRMHRPRLKRGAGQDVGDQVGIPYSPTLTMSVESTTACHWARACTVRPVVAATSAQVVGSSSPSRGG